jgi:GTP-binding protein LepA
MEYIPIKAEEYILNLIDTLDVFSYEVSRSIAACEGALLIVMRLKAFRHKRSLTCILALENDLEIIPVLNKMG